MVLRDYLITVLLNFMNFWTLMCAHPRALGGKAHEQTPEPQAAPPSAATNRKKMILKSTIAFSLVWWDSQRGIRQSILEHSYHVCTIKTMIRDRLKNLDMKNWEELLNPKLMVLNRHIKIPIFWSNVQNVSNHDLSPLRYHDMKYMIQETMKEMMKVGRKPKKSW